jgi:uncharacterized protein (DUF1684 family)
LNNIIKNAFDFKHFKPIIMSTSTLSYADQINQERLSKDQLFKDPRTSPLSASAIDSFNGLDYFEVNEKFKLSGTLVADSRAAASNLLTTTGGSESVERFGTVKFSLDGRSFEMIVFKTSGLSEFSDSPGQLFLPFKDSTNDTETNPDGRYLLISMPVGGDKVELDFNRAFNPKSAYKSDFASVIAPEQNAAGVGFSAGQRKFEDRR